MNEAAAQDAGGAAQPPPHPLPPAPALLLQDCGLPAAWAGQAQWRILATGFGAGDAFLAAWHAWREDPARPALLHYVAVEASPLPADALLRAAPAPGLQPLAGQLAAAWAGLLPGVHRLAFENGRVLLTLGIGPWEPQLRAQAFAADCVFLDGEWPADAQVQPTLKAVTRLARRGAQLACGHATASLARDLQGLGWQVAPGAGPRLQARFEPHWTLRRGFPPAPPAQQAVVVGAGLAGAAAAASLARRGWRVTVLDAAAQPASGASALPAGLMAPHQTPDDNLLSRLTRAGIRITWHEAQAHLAAGRDWAPTGVLEWRGEDPRLPPDLGPGLLPWTRLATPAECARAGLAAGWWHERAAWIRPGALVQAWLAHPRITFRGNAQVAGMALDGSSGDWILRDRAGGELARAPLVVVATARATAGLVGDAVTLHPVRGQVSWARAEPAFAHPVNGHGHFLPHVPVPGGMGWIIGSTYGRGETDVGERPEDHGANLQRVSEMLPSVGERLAPAFEAGQVQAWCGVRCASSDRRPLVGPVAAGLWITTALGSRGLTFAALCGELLAARLHHEPLPLEPRLAEALDVQRQLAR